MATIATANSTARRRRSLSSSTSTAGTKVTEETIELLPGRCTIGPSAAACVGPTLRGAVGRTSSGAPADAAVRSGSWSRTGLGAIDEAGGAGVDTRAIGGAGRGVGTSDRMLGSTAGLGGAGVVSRTSGAGGTRPAGGGGGTRRGASPRSIVGSAPRTSSTGPPPRRKAASAAAASALIEECVEVIGRGVCSSGTGPLRDHTQRNGTPWKDARAPTRRLLVTVIRCLM